MYYFPHFHGRQFDYNNISGYRFLYIIPLIYIQIKLLWKDWFHAVTTDDSRSSEQFSWFVLRIVYFFYMKYCVFSVWFVFIDYISMFVLLSLGRYPCWWTICPWGYHQPSMQDFDNNMVYEIHVYSRLIFTVPN
jgi:hypothetical protein